MGHLLHPNCAGRFEGEPVNRFPTFQEENQDYRSNLHDGH